MVGRPKHYPEKILINKATEVFWKKGYTASSAQDLMKAMDIGQGSFYRTFPGGKNELYQKTLNLFLEQSIKLFYERIAAAENPVQFIKDFFYAITLRTNDKKENGCYLGNAIVESSNLDENSKLIATKQLIKLQKGFEKALEKAQSLEMLSAQNSPKLLAAYLINLWNGINVTQRMNLTNKEMAKLLELNLQILN
ncbi:TetR family transcriptional regulator [Maribacter vaceletii]|uniref:TetR family transcriptional regulator n=1 Tax=Maribacter vaceletii TaxID=1206816 RepID=A0A495DWK2_9FLAO|nr:TetR/AcrR family transcriptional regulator [Maribacter vaceletii]RKR07977.1 TetR family transcriptional regulator [Maribacter vaceletii]